MQANERASGPVRSMQSLSTARYYRGILAFKIEYLRQNLRMNGGVKSGKRDSSLDAEMKRHCTMVLNRKKNTVP